MRAAKEAQNDADFVLAAGTFATATESLDDVIRRCNAYAEAGADLILPYVSAFLPYTGSKTTKDELLAVLRRFVDEVNAPVITHSPHGLDLAVEDAQTLGIKMYIMPQFTAGVAAAAARGMATALREGRLAEYAQEHPPHPVRELSDILGLREYERAASEKHGCTRSGVIDPPDRT